ncbi:MAG: DUF6044 family protein [Lachnospiraceae bacterium]|nr:DUF6044 family protein [Lachnospiraceae bacterium]
MGVIVNNKRINQLANLSIIFIFIIAFAPLFYHGENAIFPIHDGLDEYIPWITMAKNNNLLFTINTPVESLGGLSSAYLSYPQFNINILYYYFFEAITALIIEYIITVIIGFFAMYILLSYFFSDENVKPIIKLVSLTFAFVPAFPSAWIASAPLLLYFFIKISKSINHGFDKRVLLLIFFPLISDFVFTGFFLLGLWFLGIFFIWIKNRKFNLNLFISFLCLICGYILTNIKLFYFMFAINEPLNRELALNREMPGLNEGLRVAVRYFNEGHYHAPTYAERIIIPIGMISFVSLLIFALIQKFSKKYKGKHNSKGISTYLFYTSALLLGTFIFSLTGGLYATWLRIEIYNIFPLIAGFNWGRLFFLNRLLLYIWFAYTLIIIKPKILTYLILMLQILFIFTSLTSYNYASFNLLHNRNITKTSILSYQEFYAKGLFNKIKEDINYNGEGVAAVGYHPGILKYNGFSCIDLYNSSYSLSYTLAFREIIEPQLDYNPRDKHYFDTWGGRMYLFCDDAPYRPTRKRLENPITLRINTEAFKNLGGVYILSRGLIGNASELNLELIYSYTDLQYVYDIFVYKVMDNSLLSLYDVHIAS